MSREILFRAERVDNGELVYGFYVCIDFPNSKHQIVEGYGNMWETHDIDIKTLAQFTGLTDKNGVKIFEGDCFDVLFQDIFNSTLIAKVKGVVIFKNGIYWVEFIHPIEKENHISALNVFLDKNPKEVIPQQKQSPKLTDLEI